MSYQDCRPLFKYREEELIALFIETLTGTTFEMTASPYDTIKSIKSKIQRVEGIPVSQQHLLYNLHELEDSAVLMDYSITNGSTIKLVLSMRGGPISTVRRILPLDDITWKELVDFNRDDLLDDLPPGCRMAVLVFREGDHLNMFKVLENVDGSYSPLSDSWSGSSMRNLFEEDDSDECDKQRHEENSVTMEKMNDLKNKLEQLAIQRQNKFKNLNDSEKQLSVVNSLLPESICKEIIRKKNKTLSASKRKNSLQQLPPLGADKNFEVSEMNTEDQLRKTRTAEFSRVPVLPDISPSPTSVAVFDSNTEDSMAISRPKTSPDHQTGHRICEILSEAGRHRLLGGHHCNTSPLHSIPQVPAQDNNFEADWCSSSRLSSRKPLDKPSTSASIYRRNSNIHDRNISRTAVVNPFNIFQGRNDNSNGIASLFSNSKLEKLPVHNISPRRNSIMNHTTGGRLNKLTLASFQSLPKENSIIEADAIKPKCLEIPSSSSSKQLSPLLSESARSVKNISLTNSQSEECKCKLSSSFNKVEEKVSSNKADSLVRGCGSSNNNLIKPISKKKKKEPRSRCMKCSKRLTLTNTYTCRCGRIFCTNHRYSEAHDCTYDYKSEGRKILEQNNPLISAPKLPKI